MDYLFIYIVLIVPSIPFMSYALINIIFKYKVMILLKPKENYYNKENLIKINHLDKYILLKK